MFSQTLAHGNKRNRKKIKEADEEDKQKIAKMNKTTMVLK